MSLTEGCHVGVTYGPESDMYSFPNGHPMNRSRTLLFRESLSKMAIHQNGHDGIAIIRPKLGRKDDLKLFHTTEYIELVESTSKLGEGFLDYPDTPVFPQVYEASLYVVGSTLLGLEAILNDRFDHFFNPVGGLHHARRDRASGFCVFNDPAIAIAHALTVDGIKRVAYVDIDAHHGDGVYYGFETDPRVWIADIHEDGRSLFPGTGSRGERGKGEAAGTKINIPLRAGSGDSEFIAAFDIACEFVKAAKPELILLQCGADGLYGDPLTHLQYTEACHAYAAMRLHKLAHASCDGRIMAMGGGGYNATNVDSAWSAIIREFSGSPREISPSV